nr:hypothetical protein GCM10025730_21950 [Promicromonospora thailandica]
MRNAWRKSSQSADACAEATVLDLTVRGGAVVGMSPVPLRGAKLDDAVSDTVADVVGDGIPTTVHDAWDAFAAQDPKSADGLLLEARQLFRAKKDEEILDEPAARDLAIKAAFGALTDVDRKMPLVSQAELLYNQVLAGRRYLADGGNPVDQLIAALRSVNNVRAFMNPAERQVIDGIESGVIAVTANQAAALRQAGIAAHSVLSLTPQQTQYAGAGQWSSGSSYAPQQAYAPQRVYASSSGGTSSSQQSRVPALSPQMIDARYRRLAPDLSTLLERLDYAGDMRELANGINAHHYLVMDERDAHGRLSNRAMQAYEVGRQRFVDAEMSAILGRSSVVAEGISDNELRNLPREQVFWHPELESYLERSNLGHHFDRNGALEVFREQIGPLRVNFHRERRYDPVVQRSQQRMRNAVIALQQRGYQFQEAELQVYLPRYADRITVTRSRGTGRPVDIRREVIVGNSHTHFVPPNNILLMPRSGVEFPVGFQRSGDVADLGVYDRVAHIAEAGIVHEVAHFLHYQNNPRAMADLLNTALIDDENTEITGEVSAYASENPAEFVAEYVTATRYDMGFDPEVRQALSALNAAFGGPELVPGAVPLRAPSLTAAELTYLRPLVVRELRMRGHDFVPDDGQLQWAQARLRGFAQWAVHDERAGAIAHVFMESLASSTSGTGTSRSVYGPYYPQVRMTDDSDGRRNGFGTVLESERAKQNPDPTTVATLERFAAQWSGSPQDGASIARSTGSTGEAAARVAPLAALDATPRGSSPHPSRPSASRSCRRSRSGPSRCGPWPSTRRACRTASTVPPPASAGRSPAGPAPGACRSCRGAAAVPRRRAGRCGWCRHPERPSRAGRRQAA